MNLYRRAVTLAVVGSAVSTLMMAGCSSTEKKFDHIVPGMSTDQVKNTMDQGPSHFENIANTEYASWYWGDGYCVLFKNDKVVAKDAAQTGNSGSAGPVKYEETRKAHCLAPGQTAKTSTDRTVSIPGVGTVHLPGSGG